MIAANVVTQAFLSLGEIGTMHVWFTSEGQRRGKDVIADVGEFLCLPGDCCGCDGSPWWDLLGTIKDGCWEWNGEDNPSDCDGRRVTRIVAFF